MVFLFLLAMVGYFLFLKTNNLTLTNTFPWEAGAIGMAINSFEQWEKCIRVNLIAVMALCSHAIQYLEKNESSSSRYFNLFKYTQNSKLFLVIQISSIAAKRHFPIMPPCKKAIHRRLL